MHPDFTHHWEVLQRKAEDMNKHQFRDACKQALAVDRRINKTIGPAFRAMQSFCDKLNGHGRYKESGPVAVKNK